MPTTADTLAGSCLVPSFPTDWPRGKISGFLNRHFSLLRMIFAFESLSKTWFRCHRQLCHPSDAQHLVGPLTIYGIAFGNVQDPN